MLKRKDGSALKRERIRQIHTMIKGAGDLSLKRFLAVLSYNIGLSAPTSMRYLRDLESLDLIEVDEALDLVREVIQDE